MPWERKMSRELCLNTVTIAYTSEFLGPLTSKLGLDTTSWDELRV